MRIPFDRQALTWVCVLTLNVAVQATPIAAPPQSHDQAKDQGDASKGSKDIDQTVAYSMAQVLTAAKEALATYGCSVKKERADYLECTRDRHFGVMVGSGGEKVTVQLTPKGNETRIEIKTGKGFAGRLGKKNWSTPIFEETLKTLKAS